MNIHVGYGEGATLSIRRSDVISLYSYLQSVFPVYIKFVCIICAGMFTTMVSSDLFKPAYITSGTSCSCELPLTLEEPESC